MPMQNDRRPVAHGLLPYDPGGELIELLWTRLRAAMQRQAATRLPNTLAGSASPAPQPSYDLRRLPIAELRELLAIAQHRIQVIQRDIAQVEAALKAAE